MYLLKLIGEKECLCKFKIMSDSVKYWEEQNFGEQELRSKEIKTEEKDSQDVINILDLFKMLSIEDKITIIRKLRQEKLFN